MVQNLIEETAEEYAKYSSLSSSASILARKLKIKNGLTDEQKVKLMDYLIEHHVDWEKIAAEKLDHLAKIARLLE